ncbi:MAG TPA: hypothetical protein EYO94_09735 [Acidobacteria bacterium]|nr:hypothetical protein [Acidobacteriota bacterium]
MSSFLNRTMIHPRLLMGSALVATLAIGIVLGMFLTTNTVEAQPETTFDGSAALMFHFVKPGATGDYEAVMQKLGEALNETGKTDLAAGWKVYRAGADFTGQGAVPYVWAIDPVVSGANYAAATIINDIVMPDEMQQIFESYNAAFTDGDVKQLPVQLELVADF